MRTTRGLEAVLEEDQKEEQEEVWGL